MADMKTTMNSVNSVRPTEVAKPGVQRSDRGLDKGVQGDFRSALQSLQQEFVGKTQQAPLGSLKFSNHAVERMQSRGISFSPEQMGKIESAVQKAAAKGSKDTLLLTDASALIVSVKDNTVVTVMDRAGMKDNVFTNIDSTVMI